MLFVALRYFLRHNQELLLLVVLFILVTGVWRFQAILSGTAYYVNVAYTISIFDLNDDTALRALNLFFLGTVVFCSSFIFFNKTSKTNERATSNDNQNLFQQFLLDNSTYILGLSIIVITLGTFLRGLISGTLAVGNSYFIQFINALGGLILLLFLLFKYQEVKLHFLFKILVGAILIYGIILTYNPSARFQFLSWMIALGVILQSNSQPFTKIKRYLLGGTLVLFIFGIAGASREIVVEDLTFEESIAASFERVTSLKDANMLDGFMMVLDVYPNHLNYHLGGEHFEILLRPIPRQLWSGKPVGGYANKLGLNDYENSGTVGISQTIYGTFYGEGGIIGIILFSWIYGWVFVRLFRYADRYTSDVRWLIRGIILASCIPILRGGDLPGIIAWIGMSYWPVFLIVYRYNKFLFNSSNAPSKLTIEETGKTSYHY